MNDVIYILDYLGMPHTTTLISVGGFTTAVLDGDCGVYIYIEGLPLERPHSLLGRLWYNIRPLRNTKYPYE